jgi:hypothetical protein
MGIGCKGGHSINRSNLFEHFIDRRIQVDFADQENEEFIERPHLYLPTGLNNQ